MVRALYKTKKHIRRYEKNFSEETRDLFTYNYECWVCGKNKMDALHHILGGNFEQADSPLNAAPICNMTCHLGRSFSFEDDCVMLQKTIRYLLKLGYELNEKDIEFYKKFEKYYDYKIDS